MVKFKSLILFFLFIVLMLIGGCTFYSVNNNDNEQNDLTDHSYDSEKITIGCIDFPPFIIIEDGKFSGISIDVIKEIFNKLGVSDDEYEFVELPWARLIEAAKVGEIQIILELGRNDEREIYFEFSEEVLSDYTIRLITKEGINSNFDPSVSLLEDKVFGVVRGYSYTPEIDALIEKSKKVIETSSSVELFELLYTGRIDF